MITAETIEELKKSHPDAWRAKRAASLTEQQAAQVILSQIEIDKANPPHLEAVKRAKGLVEIANLKASQFATVRIAAERMLAELGEHAELVDLTFIDPAGRPASTADLEQARAINADLNRLLDECREFGTRQDERIKELEADLAVKAERISQITDELQAQSEASTAACTAKDERIADLEADMRLSHEALSTKPKKK